MVLNAFNIHKFLYMYKFNMSVYHLYKIITYLNTQFGKQRKIKQWGKIKHSTIFNNKQNTFTSIMVTKNKIIR